MTDSPKLNLDDAHKAIDSGCHKQIRSVETGEWEVLIGCDYLESIVSELEAGRERTADLESRCDDLLKRNDWLRKTLDDSPWPELRIEISGLTEKLFGIEKGEFWQALNRIGAIPDDTKDQIICDLEGKLAKAIIPQAEDAHILSEALDLIERNLYYEDNVNSDLCKVIRRYLAAIEGGKP